MKSYTAKKSLSLVAALVTVSLNCLASPEAQQLSQPDSSSSTNQQQNQQQSSSGSGASAGSDQGRVLTAQESAAGAQAGMTAEKAITSWSAKPKEAAQKLIAKYGQPNEVTSQRLIWHNNGPWKTTELVNEEVKHDFPISHTDFLKQTVDYKVPPEKFSELAKFDGSVIAERTKGELSARCDKEENNMLGINLAQDVATGSKTAEEARAFFTKTIAAAQKGEQSDYMKTLKIAKATTPTADPDRTTLVSEAAGGEAKPSDQKSSDQK